MQLAMLLLAFGGALGTPTPAPLPVIGGNVAEACEWPMTVLMSGCSGTLVHPEVVLYAAHCPNTGSIRFGTTGGERTVSTTTCRAAPEYPATGFDYAYCQLAEPVTDVPIVPIMMGCERDQLQVDTRAWMVGFGNTSNGGGGFGTKRWIEGAVAGFPAGGKQIGVFYDDPDTGICSGDSGGSAYAQLDDGTWRLFGIASTVPGSCGGSSQHVPAWAAVEWIEEDSGIDITPCHDADGAWNPGADCGSFPTAPGDENGLGWGTGCGPGPLGDAAQTCGAAFGEPQDGVGPEVSFVTPAAGAYPGPSLETGVELLVSDDSGILDVELTFADETQAFFEAPPYTLGNVVFPEGTWELVATARDWSGNVTQTSVVLEVGADAGSSSGGAGQTTGAETTSGGDSGGAGADDSSGGAPEPGGGTTGAVATGGGSGGDSGAGGDSSDGGCHVGARRGVSGWLLLVFGSLLALRRRRRPASS